MPPLVTARSDEMAALVGKVEPCLPTRIGAADDVAQPPRSGSGGEGGALDLAALMLDLEKHAHPMTRTSFSLSISACTSATQMPALGFGGSATFSVVSRGVRSMS